LVPAHSREKFYGNVVIAPLRDASGQLRGFSCVVQDITERKRGEGVETVMVSCAPGGQPNLFAKRRRSPAKPINSDSHWRRNQIELSRVERS
jgi:hypothetical protein